MRRTALLALLAACASAPPDPSNPSNGALRFNVLLVLVDDAGAECFSPYGRTEYTTPNLDRLAAEGVRFDACHSTPLCTPSRVELLTGRSSIRSYASFSVLDREERTFAHLFQDAGYATGVMGKWQLYGAEHYGERAGTGTRPEDAGFDTWCLWQVEELGSRYWAPRLEVDGTIVQYAEDRYGPDVFTSWGEQFVEQHRDEPFLLYYPMALVHDPFVPTPDSTPEAPAKDPANFADMVAYADSALGRLLDALERNGVRERTLVIFVGDNGSPRPITSQLDGRPVRGGKGRTTDVGTWVPLIASLRGRSPAGSSNGNLVGLVDFLPTLAEAARIETPRNVDGRSFLAQIVGLPGGPRDVLYTYYNPRPDTRPEWERRWARDLRYKLYATGELYDVAADPDELEPLGPDEAPGARRRLAAELARFPAEPRRLRAADWTPGR